MSSPNAFTNLRGKDPGANRQTDSISRVIDPVCRAVMATPIMGAAPPAWIRPPLASPFVDSGGGYVPMRYHRDVLGYVHVQAFVSATVAALAGSTLTTLPPGFRPGFGLVFTCDSTVGFMSVVVNSDGRITHSQAMGAGWSITFAVTFLAER